MPVRLSGGIGRRMTKLRAMSGAEVVERVRYRADLLAERAELAAGRLAHKRLPGILHQPLRTGEWRDELLRARRDGRTRFLAGVRDAVAMRRLFDTRYAAERDATFREAERTRRNEFEFFGRVFQYGDGIDWQADPVTGVPWPRAYHAAVPVHGGDVGAGDVKYVWELNRQQYLVDLGKAYFLRGEPQDLLGIERLIRSWIAGNPYAFGVNWACALEPAFRALSWLWSYHLVVERLDDDFHIEWLDAFHDLGRFLARHLEYYSSPFNHLIGEASALYILGACFPEFEAAEAWRRKGRAVLEGRLAEQFYADGGSVEQSPFYHHATVGFYLLAALVARAHNEPLSDTVWKAIERGLEFSLALTQPDGTTPAIGGADDGKPIRMEHLPLWDFRPLLAAGAVLFERAEFKRIAGRFHEDALWLLGPRGLESFESLSEREPDACSIPLEASGHYVLRSNWSVDADYVCFDCGEQAAGIRTDAVPNSMHGHADCLSVIVWLNGRPVLVDSGLYAYNCGGEWEAHFRETAAHNTARIDGRDQARHLGKMAWSHGFRATREAWGGDGQQAWVAGSHDGYARGPQPVTHRRAVWLRGPGCVVICDEFVGRGEHDLEVNFQFAPGTLAPVESHAALFNHDRDIVWGGSAAWDAEYREGGTDPASGWIAPSLGVRVPAPRLTLRTRMTTSRVSLLTVLAARILAAPRAVLVRFASHALPAIAVQGDGWTDWFAMPSDDPAGPLQTDAVVGAVRIGCGQIESMNHIGGTSVAANRELLIVHDPFASTVLQ